MTHHDRKGNLEAGGGRRKMNRELEENTEKLF